MKVGERRYKVTLDSGNFFYLAGIWEPNLDDAALPWYRIITVFANPEVERYQERHGAIIQRSEVMKWLDATVPTTELLVTPPRNFFFVEELGRKQKQGALSV
jgi:putative SOS response-associated peptidase YedK